MVAPTQIALSAIACAGQGSSNCEHSVSVRDLLQFLLLNDQKLSYVPGKTDADAMSADVITSDPITDVRRARVMTDYHLTAIPIVDASDSLIGLISRSDILRCVANDPPLSLWS